MVVSYFAQHYESYISEIVFIYWSERNSAASGIIDLALDVYATRCNMTVILLSVLTFVQLFSTCGPRPSCGPRTSAWWTKTQVGHLEHFLYGSLTRLKMEIGMFFLCLSLKKARNFGKFRNCLGKWLKKCRNCFVVLEWDTVFREMIKKGRQIINFAEKMWKFFGGPRTEAKFVKWSASRKRLRTAA